jgi:hypothetical protein
MNIYIIYVPLPPLANDEESNKRGRGYTITGGLSRGGSTTHLIPFSFAHSMNAAVRSNLEAVVVVPPPPPPPPWPPLSADDAVAANDTDVVDDDDGRENGRVRHRRRGRLRSTAVEMPTAAVANAGYGDDDDARDDGDVGATTMMPANAAAAASQGRRREQRG